MSEEIERKFLLNELPADIATWPQPATILQGYLQKDQHKDLRIRKKGSKYTLTAKHGTGLVRKENEQEIDKTLFDILWPFTAEARIEKLRYTRVIDEGEMVIDKYLGDLSGLLLMEVEFNDEQLARTYSPPLNFAKEVTDDPRYRNAALAAHGTPAI